MPNNEFRPDWASAPGDTIADILRERKLSEIEFATEMGRTLEEAKNLLQGQASITIGLARRLESFLGASVEFWMSREFQYRQDMARLQRTDEKWLSELPIGDMVKFGWLSKPEPSDEVESCLRFFNVPTVSAWRGALERGTVSAIPFGHSRTDARKGSEAVSAAVEDEMCRKWGSCSHSSRSDWV